jgi:hypothetical protein
MASTVEANMSAQAEQISPIPEVNSEAIADLEKGNFLSQRWQSLKETYSDARDFVGRNIPKPYGVDGKRLTWGQNARVNLVTLGRSIRDESVPYEVHERRATTDVRAKERNFQRRRQNPKEMTGVDLARLAAFEVFTLAPVRMIGVAALAAATSSESGVGKWADNRNAVYEQALHNPTTRRLKGYKRQDTRDLTASQAKPVGRERLSILS